jgi:hypothetical protein
MSERSVDEKTALSLHRYKTWIEVMNTAQQRFIEAKRVMDEAAEQLVYAYLEAREEQETLLAAGLSENMITATAGVMPVQPLDPLTLLKRARAYGT